MKTTIIFTITFILGLPLFAQVGVGTTSPTATLDVNGTLRIRAIEQETILDVAKDSILVVSRNGFVNRISSKQILNAALKTAIKGNFSTSGALNLWLGAGTTYTKIPFDNEIFDYNEEFDTTTNVFTAKQDGIYNVTVQINSTIGISASSNYGVCILKNSTIVAKENYSNINISVLSLDVDISPPVRKSNTLVQLSEGETISFQVFSDLVDVDLSASQEDSYFTIVQIR